MVPETRWAEALDGGSIAYQDVGEGPRVLVLVNGWISHLEVYWEQPRFARFMRRLSANLRVLVFDKRGMGMSDRLTSGADLEVRMDDVRAVLDSAGVDRAALLGWGTGGPPLALFFAASQPHRTLAVCTDGNIIEKRVPGYPWGTDEETSNRDTAELVAGWGHVEGLAERMVRPLAAAVRRSSRSSLCGWRSFAGTRQPRKASQHSTDSGGKQTSETSSARYRCQPRCSTRKTRRHHGETATKRSTWPIAFQPRVSSRFPALLLTPYEKTPTRWSAPSSGSSHRLRRRSPSSTGCWQQSCSQTSSGQPNTPPEWATRHGSSSLNDTTRWFARSFGGTAVEKCRPPATDSSRPSMDPDAPCAAPMPYGRRSSTRHRDSSRIAHRRDRTDGRRRRRPRSAHRRPSRSPRQTVRGSRLQHCPRPRGRVGVGIHAARHSEAQRSRRSMGHLPSGAKRLIAGQPEASMQDSTWRGTSACLRNAACPERGAVRISGNGQRCLLAAR